MQEDCESDAPLSRKELRDLSLRAASNIADRLGIGS